MPSLVDHAVYIGDNGRLMCRSCAGATALASGRDISGQRVERINVDATIEIAAAVGHAIGCECGLVRLRQIVGADGWPMVEVTR
jgi:hypothetical protein